MVLREYDRLPVLYRWWSQIIMFLIRMHRMSETSPLKQAYLANVDLLIEGKPCWLQGVRSFLASLLGGEFPRERDAVLQYVGMISLQQVKKAMIGKWKMFWTDVTNGVIDASKCLLYAKNIACGDVDAKHGWFMPALHLSRYMPSDIIHSNLVRFRLGNHDLLVEKKRWVKGEHQVNFDCRCTFCTSQAIEDEHHFMFSCVYFENIRLEDRYNDVYMASDGSIRSLLNHEDQIIVAKLVSELLSARVRV